MAVELSSAELASVLRTPLDGCVLLDCRPFLDFSLAHIREARSVNWNSMLRRRSKSSVVALEWLIPDKALLGRLRGAQLSPVVVLDEGSRSLAELKPESVAKMLLTALQNEAQAHICFLRGTATLDLLHSPGEMYFSWRWTSPSYPLTSVFELSKGRLKCEYLVSSRFQLLWCVCGFPVVFG